MNRISATIFLLTLIAISSSVFFFSSCNVNSLEGKILITQVSGKLEDANYETGDFWRYIPGARIAAVDTEKPGKIMKVLTPDFFSAMSPEISYDGNSMLFAAQQQQNDPWQIYEMNLKNLKTRQISSSEENCIDPAYLPNGRLLYSKMTKSDAVQTGYSLHTCNPDGTDIVKVTFNPHSYFASSVLMDGRVLTISKQLHPYTGQPTLMVMRPDGTKAELFYKGANGSTLYSRGREALGKIVFIEADSVTKRGGNLVAINYNRPLHSRTNLTSGIASSFHSVFPLKSGKMLVTYRQTETERYALYEFDPELKALGSAIHANTDYDVLEAVLVEKHERPKKLPSEVDMELETGLLLCQDINVFGMPSTGQSSSLPKADRIEVLGIDSTFGIVEAEADGSFYLKVKADTPFRIQTIDEKGRVLNGPCGWIWLRPNERRGCVGCHEDPELVPDNRQPLAVRKSPVIVPAHIIRGKEKTVELE